MKKTRKPSLVALCVLLVACGFTVRDCGLTARDFVMVSENGFDPVDNAQDGNLYPWSMEYFVPDGADDGYLYVGTGSNIANIVPAVIGVLTGEGGLEAASLMSPEIRRYRPEYGAKAWERVFDYRDVDPESLTIGFRFMTTYRAISDGVNYVYAATMGADPALWRSATGEPGEWESVGSIGGAGSALGSIRWMSEHGGILYVCVTPGLEAETPQGAIWATDGATFWPVVEDGFGNPDNSGVYSLASYGGWLYAGTMNYATGYEVWKLEGPGDDGTTPVQVVAGGGPDPRNEGAMTMYVFDGKLYVGSGIGYGYNPLSGNGFKGCDLIRLEETGAWETIVGPNSRSGYDSGFGCFTNAYLWWMEEHDGWLYASTYDMATSLSMLAPYIKEIIELIEELSSGGYKQASALDRVMHAGGDLYKSPDGVTWQPVFIDGLGDPGNWGIRTMKSVGDYLYLGMGNPFDGLEIWRGRSPVGRQ